MRIAGSLMDERQSVRRHRNVIMLNFLRHLMRRQLSGNVCVFNIEQCLACCGYECPFGSEPKAAQHTDAQANAERDRNNAKQLQLIAEADSDRNRAAAVSSDVQLQQAVHDREELRARLLQQFNLILETRDTARGLVVNMSDVLFDSGRYTLRPLAREKLAKISGTVLGYPSLRLAIEGNTDSVGTEAFNQQLSEQRAEGVRAYLAQQGVPESSTTATGFGKTRPIASNDTSEGRQQNRRVELLSRAKSSVPRSFPSACNPSPPSRLLSSPTEITSRLPELARFSWVMHALTLVLRPSHQ